LLLVAMVLVKMYLGPLAVLYALWSTAGRPPPARLGRLAALGALAATLVILAYLPYADAGRGLIRGALAVGQRFSDGTAPDLVRAALVLLLGLGGMGARTAAPLAATIARGAAGVAIAAAFLAAARRLRPGAEPWGRWRHTSLLTSWLRPGSSSGTRCRCSRSLRSSHGVL
jgi:hypothetical protein